MVKMDLGSSNAQSSSTATVTSNHIAAYQGLIASLQGFSGTADLKGAAYDSAKTYASSVLVPLLQGAILLSEKIASSTAKLPSEYSNQVAPESLDSADLERQIATYTAAYNRANEWLTQEMKRDVVDDRNVLQAQKAMARHLAKKHELEEKLRKLLAFNNTSASLFSEVDGLFQAVSQGMSQVKAGFSSFDGTFKVPAKSDMSWATTITSSCKKQEVSYKTVKDKIVKGESLTSKDIEVIQTYGRLHPNETVSPKIVKAVNQYSMSNGSISSLPEKNQKFSDILSGMKNIMMVVSYSSTANVATKEAAASVKKIKNGTWVGKTIKSTKSGKKTWKQVNGDISRFKKVKNAKSADELINGTGSLTKGGGFKGFTKSVGVLGGTMAVLDGVTTYIDREEKYGKESAAIDGVAHTATAVGSLYVGAAIGSAIPIPVVGTVAGAVGGYLVGGITNTLYDGFAHGKWNLDNFALW